METSRVDRRGAIVVSERLRRRFGIVQGSLVVAEERGDGILIRPADVLPLEDYSPEHRAAFLLSNALNATDYQAALKEVRKMGMDPAKIDHQKPARRRAKRS